jgi:hypothetical protein
MFVNSFVIKENEGLTDSLLLVQLRTKVEAR